MSPRLAYIGGCTEAQSTTRETSPTLCYRFQHRGSCREGTGRSRLPSPGRGDHLLASREFFVDEENRAISIVRSRVLVSAEEVAESSMTGSPFARKLMIGHSKGAREGTGRSPAARSQGALDFAGSSSRLWSFPPERACRRRLRWSRHGDERIGSGDDLVAVHVSADMAIAGRP